MPEGDTVFKLAAYLDLAVYQPTRFGPEHGNVRFAVATGLGISFLVLDFAQFDFYYGIGWVSDNRWDHGLSGRIVRGY